MLRIIKQRNSEEECKAHIYLGTLKSLDRNQPLLFSIFIFFLTTASNVICVELRRFLFFFHACMRLPVICFHFYTYI